TRAIAAAGIEPVVDKVFSQNEAAEAYTHMAAGGLHFGKLVFGLEW
ncbi:NAD(P)-dependent alcohol dehydrogenase, partial [Mesorhizobium sp. M4A.F.Ca.ET.029.04.2.1]